MTAGLQSALDGEKESFNQWLKQFGVQARVEIPTILGPERGLEMLTAVQWRQKLGLTDFRCEHVFLREVAAKRNEGSVQEWNS